MNCRPLLSGGDIVTHSTTKYMTAGSAVGVDGDGNLLTGLLTDKFPGLTSLTLSYHNLVYADSLLVTVVLFEPATGSAYV